MTNVLDPKRLSREDWVRLADNCDQGQLKPGLYHRRWEIETSFRELKVVLHTKSLRSRTPVSVEYELAGRVIYYLLIRWLIVQAAEAHGIEPLRISFTNAVRELEAMRPTLLVSDESWVKRELMPRLLDRIASHLVAFRPGRHYPRPNDTQPKDRGNGVDGGQKVGHSGGQLRAIKTVAGRGVRGTDARWKIGFAFFPRR